MSLPGGDPAIFHGPSYRVDSPVTSPVNPPSPAPARHGRLAGRQDGVGSLARLAAPSWFEPGSRAGTRLFYPCLHPCIYP